jgi:Family of unknown function (DUF6114)
MQKPDFPGTASVLAIVGAALMIVSGVLIFVLSQVVLPGINHFLAGNITTTVSGTVTKVVINNSTYTILGSGNHFGGGNFPFQSGAIPGFVTSIIGFVGTMGIISGVVVLASALMLRNGPYHRTLWGALIVVFSVLSFFGAGGFVIGAILGIIGGIMALTWKPTAPPAGMATPVAPAATTSA